MTIQEAERFDIVWKKGKYDGFSSGTNGEVTTPFLELLLGTLQTYSARLPHVIEGGAGSGNHSFTLARRGCRVTSVEYSGAAADKIKARKQAQPCSYRDRITVVQGDLLGYLQNGAESALAFYANSVLHFFSADERAELYERVRGLQPARGLIAVSFKAEGDALQSRGDVIEEIEAGVLVKSREDDITRLFVRNPGALAREIEQAGYLVPDSAIHQWEVQGYNHQGEAGKFVGFLGVKR
ncbi:hypothetical protein COV17_00580 [Candidatus Woesearchaeota archaeon CG10_big_fil_rev_8_21_14_0_10_36_11]|nr:MAG: hypothetical protein COV17_00580 [Candidatus Woesearchaeota archaeon CG10_big_fil_rev_8_21_14_0_10_36_11]